MGRTPPSLSESLHIGIHEYVIGRPPDGRQDDFRRLTEEVIPSPRAR